ncbi:histone deacetylase complex subunit SAP25 isoform X2 [Phyllostomus discolor]|uniref:Histone deacetylase complex subunit SAP25 isoform X2 n=1 Tax=Phyllostomus discolor TaxID=89673 RepID=A0A7E6DBF4_9CHIR|nr:histone deacetylase complex subunit SAP25 isoform X2 [Phyllostomus discolor]
MELKAGVAALTPPTGGARGTPSGSKPRGPEMRPASASPRGRVRRGMLPWPSPRWDRGKEQAPKEQGSSPCSGPGKDWNSGEEAVGGPGTPPQDSPLSWSPGPSGIQREQLLAQFPSGLVSGQSRETPVPLPPQMAWEVAPSRMTLLAPWDPNYKAKAGPQLVWGPSCASGASFSGRTLCHPSFWPLYDAALGRGCRPLATTGHQNRFPVMCGGDIFLSDPLLPPGQRVPLYLSEASQQVMGSLKLQLPPPIMSPWVHPTRSPGCSTAWLSGPELIALTGLLQMSQEEPRPSCTGSSAAPTPPAGSPDPVSDHPGPTGGQSCSHCTDPSLPQPPDTCRP